MTTKRLGLRPMPALVGLCCLTAAAAGFAAQNDRLQAEAGEEGIARVLARGVAPPRMAPPRGDEARGPFDRLLLTNAMVVTGTGAPPYGPVTIEVHNDRIHDIRGRIGDAEGAEVIDVAGGYVLPGLIDAHARPGTPPPEP